MSHNTMAILRTASARGVKRLTVGRMATRPTTSRGGNLLEPDALAREALVEDKELES